MDLECPPSRRRPSDLQHTIAEAAREIGILPPSNGLLPPPANGKAAMPAALRRKVLGYAQFAWAEYESVEKK